jgi:hypothetical protein
MPKSWPLGSHGCDRDTSILKMVSGSIMISYHTQQPLPQVPVLIYENTPYTTRVLHLLSTSHEFVHTSGSGSTDMNHVFEKYVGNFIKENVAL